MLKFYYAPWSRSAGVHWLLEELGVAYEPVHIDIRAEGGVPEDYRRIQPNKKVPAVDHDGTIVTERAAITIYLADAFPQAGLAPAIEDPARAAYLTWTVYCDAVFDPCVAMRAQGHTGYGSNSFSFGLFDDMVANVERHLSQNAFAAGDRFTAADTQLASAIAFTMNVLRVLPERSAFRDYLGRTVERPAYRRAQASEQEVAMAMPFFQKQFAARDR
jgi:glutathione S-transferase